MTGEKTRSWHSVATRTAGGYAILGLLWVVLTDRLVWSTLSNHALAGRFSVLKGVGFVVISAGLLYLGLSRQLQRAQENENARRAAEAALRTGEDRLRLALKGSQMGVWEWEISNGSILWSPECREITGLSQAAGGLADFQRLVHPDDRPQVMAETQRALTQKNELSLEFRIVRPDGQVRWVHHHGVGVYDAAGKPLRLVGTLCDITARTERDSSMQMQALVLEKVGQGVNYVDAEGRIRFCNPAFEKMFGYAPGELRGEHVSRLNNLAPEANQQFVADVMKQVERNGCWSGLVQNRRKDGTPFETRSTVTALRTGAGLSFVALQEDVTERKRFDEALQLFRALIEHSHDGVEVLDPDTGQVLDVNETTCRELGYTRDEMLKLTLFDYAPNVTRELFFENREWVATSGTTTIEDVHRRKDGTEFPVEVSLSSVTLDQKYFVAGVRNISARKRAEAELQRAHRQLRELSRRVLDLQESERRHLALELHDQIGQTITAAKLSLQGGNPEGAAASPASAEAIGILDHLLDQVRTLSLNLRPTMLDDLGLVPALRWYLSEQGQRAHFQAEFSAALADDEVPAPLATVCFRIVQEALTNVARHAAARNVTLRLWRGDDQLHVAVRDDGRGFDPSAPVADSAGGVHLGLLGMRERAALVGGELGITSSPGAGTEVHAVLPLPREFVTRKPIAPGDSHE